MKIAFTSCMTTTVFPDQPVWDQIAAHPLDHLVLTGDSVYIDTPPYDPHPRKMTDDAFARHVFSRYSDLLAQPQFTALVHKVPTHAIWDDHDFLWNEASRELAAFKVEHQGKVHLSRALFRAYLRTLEARLAPGSFPAAYNEAILWQATPAPGYRYTDLGANVALHLTDGRSWRTRKKLLGETQRAQMEQRIRSLPPDTVHLVASGIVVESGSADNWGKFQDDYPWLVRLAGEFRMIVLSGDIHANRFDMVETAGPWPLYDLTASGAAVRRLVTLLAACQNYGLLDITGEWLTVWLYHFNTLDLPAPRRIHRQSWQLQAL
jgi:3',5'-cyclic AMP phosphodiesterase CpdA